MSSHVRRTLSLTLALVLALAAIASAADAPGKQAGAPPTAPTGLSADGGQQAAMDEMMRLGMPGPNHKLLESMVGEWDAASRMWMGPGEPVTSSGVSSHRLILGGRFLEQRYTGSMMGQPYEGYGLTGYDNRKGRYTSSWVDNTMTEMALGEGTWDEATKTLTVVNDVTGMDGKPTKMKTVTVMKDADTHVFTMYMPMNGVETRMAEITYIRRKK